MVIAPIKKNTISLTSPVEWDNSDTAISVEGAYAQNKKSDIKKPNWDLTRKNLHYFYQKTVQRL